MSKEIYIYGLVDPRNDLIRYIGKTVRPKKRLWEHIRDAKKGIKTYKHEWIRQLLKQNLEPVFAILEIANEETWQEVEKEWIAKSSDLTNLTEGGDGLIGYHHSKEVREKISQINLDQGRIPPSWKNKKQSSEHIQKRVKARKRNNTYAHSEETKVKISENRKGKALGNTNTLGHRLTEEHKRKIGDAVRGKKNPAYGKPKSEEIKRKISESKKGSRHTEETKAKMKLAHAKRLGKL